MEVDSRERPFLVDKRMVTQMLAAYLEQRDHPGPQQEIMAKMADLLGFSTSEREQVGLSQKRKGPIASEEPANLADLTDRFVDFLMEEPSPKRAERGTVADFWAQNLLAFVPASSAWEMYNAQCKALFDLPSLRRSDSADAQINCQRVGAFESLLKPGGPELSVDERRTLETACRVHQLSSVVPGWPGCREVWFKKRTS
ncbi:unnamed protein product [Durusdinium trenchii]|uniref:Selenoprotein O n=1 Tax=Durusdinium trenchii TaxID=1381693 RepID=A0ABP0IN99_9DINO